MKQSVLEVNNETINLAQWLIVKYMYIFDLAKAKLGQAESVSSVPASIFLGSGQVILKHLS